MAGWLACGLYSTCPLLANVRGMEASLYLLLILAAVWSLQQQKWVLLGVLLGLLAMARADGVLMVVLLTGWLLLRRRTAAWRALAPFSVISAAWAATLWSMTGNPFPSTLTAKIAQRESGQWGSQFSYFSGLSPYGISGSELPTPLLTAWAVVLLTFAMLGTLFALRNHETGMRLLTGAAAVTVLEYGLVLRLPMYHWHYAPFTLWVIAGSAVGLEQAMRTRWRVPALVITLVTTVAFLTDIDLGPKASRAPYRQAAEWIDQDSRKPHPTIATSEVGTIGYYSRGDIIDYLGLLDARANDQIRRRDFTWWLTQKPDYFVTDGTWVDAKTVILPEFNAQYSRATSFGSLIVYRRNN